MSKLLESSFLKKLERLQLLSKRIPARASGAPGDRRSRSRGRSVEFAEHRDYHPGDDVRHIDWNAFARMDKLFLKLFVEEREETLTIVVDGSLSMQPKSLYARRLAAALAYVALCSYDRVALAWMGDRLLEYRPPLRGRSRIFQVLEFLESLKNQGPTDLDAGLRGFAQRYPRPGIVLVISDFFQPSAGIEGLKFLRYRKNEVHAIWLTSSAEQAPELRGDLNLEDVETGTTHEMTITPRVLAAYREALTGHRDKLEGWCRRHGVSFMAATDATDVEDLVLHTLRRNGMLK